MPAFRIVPLGFFVYNFAMFIISLRWAYLRKNQSKPLILQGNIIRLILTLPTPEL